MGSKHQKYFKSRGNFRARPGAVAGIDEDFNSYNILDNGNRYKNNRFQRGGNNQPRGTRFRNQYRRDNLSADGHPQTSQRVQSAPWSKINIANGRAIGVEFLFRELSHYVDGPLAPVQPQYIENDLEFFLEDNDMAQAVQSASRRITSPSGQKVIITSNRTKAPVIPLPESDVEVLKKILNQRYDTINSSMNLSQLAEDDITRQERCSFMPLSRSSVALAVSNMIGSACPDMKSLNASKNKIRYLDGLSTLTARCPKLLKLDLSHNLIENVRELDKLFIWKDSLIDLVLDSNPLCAKFHERSSYIAAVRRSFPKLQRLDGVELPPAFKTGLEEDLTSIAVHLPPIKASFFVNDQFKTVCSRFVEEYFTVFDDPDKTKREQLLQAYDDEVTFTMTAYNLSEEAMRIRSECWPEFVRDSHNIKTMGVWERYRSKLMQKGRLSVVSYLCKDFPAVKHDMSTFVVDISFATDNLICLNVSGLYRLLTNPNADGSLRFANRIFMLVPKNEGLAIINEQLFSTTFAPSQERSYRDMYVNVVASTSATMLSTIDNVASTSASMLAEADHKTLISEFSRQSGMKANWAEKCLEDCNWNFEQAAYTFAEMKKVNSIPVEAFAI